MTTANILGYLNFNRDKDSSFLIVQRAIVVEKHINAQTAVT